MKGLSFVTLIAYDYALAFRTIRSYYAIADEIILGLDIDRLTWSRQPFALDVNVLAAELGRIDKAGKIRLVEGNFHSRDEPMANDTAERNALSQMCAADHWVVQIDADEVVLNGPEFRQWLLNIDTASDIAASWITVFKVFGREALIVYPSMELTPVTTRTRGQYVSARKTAQSEVEPPVLSPLQLLHFTGDHSKEEFLQKVRNWGHARDFDGEAYYRMWDSVTLDNYLEFKNFHPHYGPLWPSLKHVRFSMG